MIPIRQNLIRPERYSAQSPFRMKPGSITIHNTYNDASAANETANLKNNYQTTSFHFAVDDIEAVQYIPDYRNAHHAGDGRYGPGNRTSLSIEICYSKSGGPRFIQAEKNAAKLTAHMLKKHGLGIQNVVPHQYWSGKYCPHRTLDMGWDRFLAMVRAEMSGSVAPAKPTVRYRTQGSVAIKDSRGKTVGWTKRDQVLEGTLDGRWLRLAPGQYVDVSPSSGVLRMRRYRVVQQVYYRARGGWTPPVGIAKVGTIFWAVPYSKWLRLGRGKYLPIFQGGKRVAQEIR